MALAGAGASPTDRPLPEGDWYFRDNDFDSLEAMQEAHAPILDLARRVLQQDPGPVLDLGSGNGALVDRLCHEVPGCTPFGVELLEDRARRGAAVCPEHGANLVTGDMFACPEVFERQYSLVILMPGRLVDGPAQGCDWLRRQLRTRARHILIYAYDDWLESHGSLRGLAEAAGLSTAERSPTARAALARVR